MDLCELSKNVHGHTIGSSATTSTAGDSSAFGALRQLSDGKGTSQQLISLHLWAESSWIDLLRRRVESGQGVHHPEDVSQYKMHHQTKSLTRSTSHFHPIDSDQPFCFIFCTSSNAPVADPLPCVLFPCSNPACGRRYVGKSLCTLIKPASPGGVEDGRADGKEERRSAKLAAWSGGTRETETMLSLRSWRICSRHGRGDDQHHIDPSAWKADPLDRESL